LIKFPGLKTRRGVEECFYKALFLQGDEMLVAVHPVSAMLWLQVMKIIVRAGLCFNSKDDHLCLVLGDLYKHNY